MILRLICCNVLRSQLDACEGDTKHEIACISASWPFLSQYGGIWYLKKRSNQGNTFTWQSFRRYSLFYYLRRLSDYIFSLVTGYGDITYNSRRSILGAVPLDQKISYHLFNVDYNASKTKDIVKLSRKSKWHSQQSNLQLWLIHRIDYTL